MGLAPNQMGTLPNQQSPTGLSGYNMTTLLNQPGFSAQDPSSPGGVSGSLSPGGTYNTTPGNLYPGTFSPYQGGIAYGGDVLRPNTTGGSQSGSSGNVTPLQTPAGWHFWGQHGGVGGHGVNPGQSRRWGTPDTSMRGEAPMANGMQQPPAGSSSSPTGPPMDTAGRFPWGANWQDYAPLPMSNDLIMRAIYGMGNSPLFNQQLMNQRTSSANWNPWGNLGFNSSVHR